MAAGIQEESPFARMGAVGQVITYIQRAIQRGEFSVGDRLPNETELAGLIGVGRSSLREGMRILAAYGIVEIHQGEGTFIVDRTAEQFFDFLGFMPSSSFRYFLELRRVVEIGNIITVCDKLTEAELTELQSLVNQLDYRNGLDVCVQADRMFHKMLLTSTQNPLIIQIDKLIYHMRSELLYKIMCYPEVVQDARTAHQRILDALRDRDMNRCVEEVSTHLRITEGHIERLHLV